MKEKYFLLYNLQKCPTYSHDESRKGKGREMPKAFYRNFINSIVT